MSYHSYQKAVFDYLWNKHQQQAAFTFSVRQKASKGAERNIFIGTEKSHYFGFTCWDISVYYAGSAADLLNFIFWGDEEESMGFYFQYTMTKSPHDEQNRANLEFGYTLLEEFKKANIHADVNPSENKMLYFRVNPGKNEYSTVADLMDEFEKVFNRVADPVKKAIDKTKEKYASWYAQQLSQERFNELIDKMNDRLEKYKDMPEETEDDTEEEELVTGASEEKMPNNFALNTILYGPPGTGKTFNTINRAVAIANPVFDIQNAGRHQIKAEYERLVKEGQIEFITFHQSLGYEDFIEGIKPVEPKEGDAFLKYEIKDGIFKRLCERASKVPELKSTGFSISENEFQQSGFYKISLGDTSNSDDDQIYNWCIKNGYIALGWGDAIDFSGLKENDIQQMVPAQMEKFAAQAVNYFIHYIKPGDYVVVTYGNLQFRAIGKVTGVYEFKNVDGLNVHQFRKVDWLLKDVELPYEAIYNKQFSQQSIYRLDKREIKKEFFTKASSAGPTVNKLKNYVLIIDEINRGNVSQIFGELITLIEGDKRRGNKEALEVILPYSKNRFSVPPNLYLVGTMNTADRSVEALDTALRRRFTFEEMRPKPDLLSPFYQLQRLWADNWDIREDDAYKKWKEVENEFIAFTAMEKDAEKYSDLDLNYDYEELNLWLAEDPKNLFDGIVNFGDGIKLDNLLTTINERLEVLLTKDHTIGHAWLMDVYNLNDLQRVFQSKILPLLQEFFYNDYVKIGLVLGNSFVEQTRASKSIFAGFDDANDVAGEYEDKIIYTLKDPLKLSLKDFQSIYQ